MNNSYKKMLVIQTLRETVLRKIDFTWHGIKVDWRSYDSVSRLVLMNRVSIEVDPSLGSGALYDLKNDRIVLGSAKDTIDVRSAIVHEATHCYQDAWGGKRMASIRSEQIAWLAMSLYMYHKVYKLKSQCWNSKVMNAAWELALEMETGSGRYVQDRKDALEFALQRSKSYSKTGKFIPNGIGGRTIINNQL